MRVRVGVSNLSFDHKPSETEYQSLYKSFTNMELLPAELLDSILEGRAFSHWSGEPRSKETWECSQLVGVDLEKHEDAAMDVACAHPFYQHYGAFAYSTLSHQWDAPRTRLVFLLDQPVHDKESWHWGARAVCEMWGVASDLGAADRGRSFLGSPGAMVHVQGKMLRTTTLLQLAHARERQYLQNQAQFRQEAQRRHSQQYAEKDAPDVLASMARRISSAPEGERNNTLNRAAFAAGKYLVATGRLSAAECHNTLVYAAMSSGLPQDEAAKTVTSGLTRGEQEG